MSGPGWRCDGTSYGSKVVPIGDAHPHDEDSESCPCNPRVERSTNDSGRPVKAIVHNAFDGRHLIERAMADHRVIPITPAGRPN